MVTIMNEKDVVEKSYLEDYTDKFLVLNVNSLAEKYKDAQYQLFFASGGFGCDPSKIGTAVFGIFCADGDEARFERFDFLGIATEEAVEEWHNKYGHLATKDYVKEFKDHLTNQ